MIIFVGLLTNSLLSQDKQAEGTANIFAKEVEKSITDEDMRKDSITQQIQFADTGNGKKKFYFLISAGYFLPSEAVFKTVYGSGLIYSGEIRASLFKGITLHLGGSYFSKKGEMDPLGEETTVNIYPLEAGASYTFSSMKISPYVGGGVGYYMFSEESFLGKVTTSSIGFFGQGGVALNLTDMIVIDINAKYIICNATIEDITQNIGGIRIGIGIGIII